MKEHTNSIDQQTESIARLVRYHDLCARGTRSQVTAANFDMWEAIELGKVVTECDNEWKLMRAQENWFLMLSPDRQT